MVFFRTAAGRGVFVLVTALTLATLLNAKGLRKTAEIQPQGARRDVALALMRPVVLVSSALGLTDPRHELQAAIGRAQEDRIDTTVRLTLPARPPKELPHPKTTFPAPSPPARHVKRVTHRTRPRSAVFTPSHPLKVWVAGDSLGAVPGQALERAAGGAVEITGVESRVSTGLTRPDLYNWFDRFQQEIGQHPNVVVLSFGADDEHDYMSGVPNGVTLGPLGSPSWIREYRRRVEGVTRELSAAGVYVVWLGTPIPRGAGYVHGFRVVNGVFRAVAAAHRRTSTYVDTWHMFSTRKGRYADYLRVPGGQLVRMRASDGIHYEPAAGDEIARAVLERLGRVFQLTSGVRNGRSN